MRNEDQWLSQICHNVYLGGPYTSVTIDSFAHSQTVLFRGSHLILKIHDQYKGRLHKSHTISISGHKVIMWPVIATSLTLRITLVTNIFSVLWLTLRSTGCRVTLAMAHQSHRWLAALSSVSMEADPCWVRGPGWSGLAPHRAPHCYDQRQGQAPPTTPSAMDTRKINTHLTNLK